MWRVFRGHHYLSSDLNPAASIYLVYWGETLVALAGVLPIPSGTIKHAHRMSRLVVLPDFQGLGIGTKINEFIARYYVSNGYRFYIRTSHIRMYRHLKNSRFWLESSSSGKASSPNGGEMKMNYDTERVCYSFEYLGEEYADKPARIIRVTSVKNLDRFKTELQRLRERYYLTVVTGTSVGTNEIEKLCLSLGLRTESLYMSNEEKCERKEDLRYNNIKFYDESLDILEQYDGNNYMKLAGNQLNTAINEINSNKIDDTIYENKSTSSDMKKVSLIDF